MRGDVAALNTLLRRLAGRIGDGELADLRSDLAARDLRDLEGSLLVYLAEHAIPLDTDEIALLPEYRANPEGIRIRRLVRRTPADPLPEYRFEPLDAEDSPAERYLLDKAPLHPALRTLRKTRRTPANETATARERVVYVAECTPAGDVSRLQDALDVSRYRAQTEVVADGEDLPPYQSAALAAGRLIWTRERA